jgi:hypothetical protein
MSGGHFNYSQYELCDIETDLFYLITRNPGNYGKETLALFQIVLGSVIAARAGIERVDCLMCDDDSEESFAQRFQEDLENEKENIEKKFGEHNAKLV